MKKTLTHQEKTDLANAAEASIRHPVVRGAIEEFATNMGFKLSGLPGYGLSKVAVYAAIAARCDALGIDPQAMVMDDEELADHQRTLIESAQEAGKPVIVVSPDEDDA